MLFVEVTQMLAYARRGQSLTGIQRLTFNTVTYLSRILGKENVMLLSYSKKDEQFVYAPSHLLDEFWVEQDHRGNIVRHLIALFKPWRLRKINPDSKAWQHLLASKHDQILFTESWWWKKEIVPANAMLKHRNGPKFYRFVHDLIPIFEPRFVGTNFSKMFEDGFKSELKNADVLLVNSKATADDVAKYLKMSRRKMPVKTIPLAHEFQTQPLSLTAISQKLAGGRRRMLSRLRLNRFLVRTRNKPFVLAVGTLEDRKNIYRLLRIWKDLQARHGDALPQLALVGRWGFPSKHIKRFLKQTNYLSRKATVLFDVDDAGLSALYKGCDYTMYISYSEGWGLPVGESMWFHKPVIASNSSSIPEVGGDLVDYVDPYDNTAIAQAIERLSFDRAHYAARRNALEKASLRSWNDFALDLIEAMNLKIDKARASAVVAKQSNNRKLKS